MAYSTGVRKNELRQSQLTRVMYAVCEEMGEDYLGDEDLFERVADDVSESLTTAVSVSLANKSPDRLMQKVFHFTGRID